MVAITRRAGARITAGGFGAGVGAAIVMMLVMAVLRLTTNTISIPELMEESLIRLTGGRVEAFFINQLGVGGKALLLVCIVEGTLILGGLLGLAFTHFWPPSKSEDGRLGAGISYGILLGLLLNVLFLPLVGQGFFGEYAPGLTAPPDIARAIYGTPLAPFGLPVAIDMFVLSIVFGLALAALLPRERAVVSTNNAPAKGQTGRRQFLKAAGGGALALVGGVALWGVIRAALEPPPVAGPQEVTDQPQPTPQPTSVAQQPSSAGTATAGATTGPAATNTPEPTAAPGSSPAGFEGVKPVLVPEVTPVDSFYITTKNFIDPTVDGNSWKLNFKGMVDNPYSITLKDLQAMPSVDRVETLACISNPVGGNLVGNARWKGVNFADLLNRAKPQSGTTVVVVRAYDGYADSFPMDVAMHNECVLAYEMNGAPLTSRHGYPARLLVPNIYGMKNCKWITDVEVVNMDFSGYWEAQGWSNEAIYQVLSRIDYPNKPHIPASPIYVGGIAFAGNRGIKRVEVSTDGGKTWNDANLRPPMGKYTWVLWTYPWKPAPGDYTLQVRATDGAGQLQTSNETDTYPNGATGYHTVSVTVDQGSSQAPMPEAEREARERNAQIVLPNTFYNNQTRQQHSY